jgi:replicative DNA helicase Mcm
LKIAIKHMPQSASQKELEELANTNDMYERLSLTLSQPDIDATAVQAVVLQLAGAPELETPLGENIRGNIHLAIVTGATANLSRFITAVDGLAPQETAHLNGTNTTLAGMVGSISGSNLTPGPLLDEGINLTLVEQLDSTGRKTQDALQQVLDTGTYSFAKANFRETVETSGSILLGVNPKYGNFDRYEPITAQLNLTAPLAAGVDLPIANIPRDSSDIDSGERPLPADIARDYLAYARSISPELSEDTEMRVDRFISQSWEAMADEDVPILIGKARLRESLLRFSLAHARLRLSDRTTAGDAKRAISLTETAFSDIGIQTDIEEEFDADSIETGSSSQQQTRIQKVQRIISDTEDEHDKGAPVGIVIERAADIGISENKVEHEIERLKGQGKVYLPHEDHLRTT